MQTKTIILSSRKTVFNTNAIRDVVAVDAGFHAGTATSDEFGFVSLEIHGRFETVKNRAKLTIRQARALFSDKYFQTNEICGDQTLWLREQVKWARGL